MDNNKRENSTVKKSKKTLSFPLGTQTVEYTLTTVTPKIQEKQESELTLTSHINFNDLLDLKETKDESELKEINLNLNEQNFKTAEAEFFTEKKEKKSKIFVLITLIFLNSKFNF